MASVNRNSLKLTLSGQRVTPTITGNRMDYTLRSNPAADFRYNDTVRVMIDAWDLSWPPNVMTTDSYFFTVVRDEAPPYPTGHNPAREAVNVPVEGRIVVHVRDELAGVDALDVALIQDL